MLYQKILIVDDDDDILQVMDKKLTAGGFKVIRAKRGMEAVEKAKAEMPDLILMDIVLPDIDGSEAVKLIHGEPATQQIPVIFVSGILAKDSGGHPTTELKVAGLKYHALSKPFAFETLMKEIEHILIQ